METKNRKARIGKAHKSKAFPKLSREAKVRSLRVFYGLTRNEAVIELKDMGEW